MPRILVVEDDRSVQKVLTETLAAEGFEVHCERDGQVAFGVFQQSPTDAVILDVLLPGLNGFQLAEKIRKEPGGERVPIIMLSGIYRGPQHRESATSRFGLLSYVDKPFRLEDILAPLRAALGSPRRSTQPPRPVRPVTTEPLSATAGAPAPPVPPRAPPPPPPPPMRAAPPPYRPPQETAAPPPRPPPAAPAAPASRLRPLSERERELAEILKSIEGKTHWQVLGVSEGAPVTVVRTAYVRLAKEYHPDRFATSEPELRPIADRIFARVVEANRVLSNENERRRYEEELSTGAAASQAAEKVARVLGAEKAFSQGELAFRRRRYAEALHYFEEAVRIYPEEGEYHAWVGHLLMLTRPNDPAALTRAHEEIARCKQLSPGCDKAFLFQGYLHKQTGRMEAAASEFRKAMELNERNIEAARELRLIEMRKGN